MGAWSDLELSAARLRQAHRTTPLVVADGEGGVTLRPGIEPTVPGAKAIVESKLVAKLGKHVAAYGSASLLLDAIAAEERLADGLQTLLAYGLIVSEHFAGRNTRGDVYDLDAETYERRLGEAVMAVAQTAPHVLGLTGRTGRTAGGSVASTMSTYGPLAPGYRRVL